LIENAHKISDKQTSQEASTEWINKSKDKPKPAQALLKEIIGVDELGAALSSDDG
jgi:hypothetical protein